MKNTQTSRWLSALATASALALAACGGGGAGTSTSVASNLVSNEVTIGNANLTAGQSTAIVSKALMRGEAPTSMSWTLIPLDAVAGTGATPLIGDSTCANATLVPNASASLTGEGLCQTVLNVPPGAKTGRWRLTNTAKGKSSSATGMVDVAITAAPASGFALLESSVPLTGYMNKQVMMSVPFTVADGVDVKNVKYKWTAATENPAVVAVAGAQNSAASFTPITPGQYRFDVIATADINGFPESTSASVIVIVNPPSFVDVIDAGVPKKVSFGDVVSLTGAILNRDPSLSYRTSWKQLDGVDGGPVRLTLANENSSTASFIAPSTAGTYGFEYKVVKIQTDGSEMVTTARTSVTIAPSASGVFAVSAGDVQSVKRGQIATLKAAVAAQGSSSGVTYRYSWTQVDASPVAVVLSNASTKDASFVPMVNGTYTFSVTVEATSANGTKTTVTGQTQVVVSEDGSGGVTPPATSGFAFTANAGNAQSVAANSVTTLAGSYVAQGTTTGAVYTYAWTQIGTTPATVTLSNRNAATASFIPTVAGVYNFRLTVTASLTDGSTRVATSETQVVVGSTANTFSVSAGDAQTVTNQTATNLAGVVTTQGTFTGATFTYAWTQVGASPALTAISNANALTASFIPSVAGTYTFKLTVTSNQGGVTQTRSALTQVLVKP